MKNTSYYSWHFQNVSVNLLRGFVCSVTLQFELSSFQTGNSNTCGVLLQNVAALFFSQHSRSLCFVLIVAEKGGHSHKYVDPNGCCKSLLSRLGHSFFTQARLDELALICWPQTDDKRFSPQTDKKLFLCLLLLMRNGIPTSSSRFHLCQGTYN